MSSLDMAQCPFYKKTVQHEAETVLYCEAGKVILPDVEARLEFAASCCMKNWRNCPAAQMLEHYYCRLDDK